MVLAGIILLALGSIGVCSAVALEIKYHEPIYKLLMKIFPWIFGAGGILLGIALRGG